MEANLTAVDRLHHLDAEGPAIAQKRLSCGPSCATPEKGPLPMVKLSISHKNFPPKVARNENTPPPRLLDTPDALSLKLSSIARALQEGRLAKPLRKSSNRYSFAWCFSNRPLEASRYTLAPFAVFLPVRSAYLNRLPLVKFYYEVINLKPQSDLTLHGSQMRKKRRRP